MGLELTHDEWNQGHYFPDAEDDRNTGDIPYEEDDEDFDETVWCPGCGHIYAGCCCD